MMLNYYTKQQIPYKWINFGAPKYILKTYPKIWAKYIYIFGDKREKMTNKAIPTSKKFVKGEYRQQHIHIWKF